MDRSPFRHDKAQNDAATGTLFFLDFQVVKPPGIPQRNEIPMKRFLVVDITLLGVDEGAQSILRHLPLPSKFDPFNDVFADRNSLCILDASGILLHRRSLRSLRGLRGGRNILERIVWLALLGWSLRPRLLLVLSLRGLRLLLLRRILGRSRLAGLSRLRLRSRILRNHVVREIVIRYR